MKPTEVWAYFTFRLKNISAFFQSWIKENAYIVTQAIKTKQASGEFWRMIWEQKANCIVMLTKVFDFMRVSITLVKKIMGLH